MKIGAQVFGSSQGTTVVCLVPVIFSVIYWLSAGSFLANSPAVFYETTDFIREYGFPVETHIVSTEDGFLLDIHRIPHKRGANHSSGPPVLFQHGFTCTSSIWVFQGPGKDLAFILSEEGYDIWLLNVRGNYYSSLDTSATIAFNDFSFHEMGTLDLPAVVDYVIGATGYSNVSYIGHSMGTTLLFAGLATRPEYNQKLNHVIALAPVITRSPFSVIFHKLMEYMYLINTHVMSDKLADFLWVSSSKARINSYLAHSVVSLLPNSFTEFAFRALFNSLSGSTTACHITIPPEILIGQFPDTMHRHVLNHFYYNIISGKFHMRDYGHLGNMERYNSSQPPLYNLSNVVVPVTAYVGGSDVVAPPQDFLQFPPQFPGNLKVRQLPNFHHFDVIWSEEAPEYVFADIVKDLRAVNQKALIDAD